MRVLFLVHDAITVPLGVSYLSSVLGSAGHHVSALALGERSLRDKAREQAPDLIAFGCTTGFHRKYLQVVDSLKETTGAPVLMGGAHPTFFPEVISREPCLDFAIRGEAEEAMPQLIQALEGRRKLSEVGNLVYRESGECRMNPLLPLIQDLDSIPFPDRTLLPGANRNAVFVITGRGCPYRCSYCFNHSYNQMYRGLGSMRRRRSVGNVIAEIRDLRESMGELQMIVFQDDIFIMEEEWVTEFCERYPAEIGLPFHCHLRANLVTPGMVESLSGAGCLSVKMAIETHDDHLRNRVLRRGMAIGTIEEACRAVKKAGIVLVTQNILGLPGSSMEHDMSTLDFNRRMRPDFAFATLLQPYPKTDIHQYCLDKGIIAPDSGIPDSFFDRSVLDLPHGNRLSRLRKLFALSVEFRWMRRILPLLTRLPLTPLYDMADKLWKGYCIKQREFPYKLSFREYARNVIQYFKSRYY